MTAPDLPSRSLNQKGVKISNRKHQIRRLVHIADAVHIFHDHMDYILSVAKFAIQVNYKRLGLSGYKNGNIEQSLPIFLYDATNFENKPTDLIPVEDLPEKQRIKVFFQKKKRRAGKEIWESDANQRHRYFVTSDDIVRKIKSLM